MDVSAELFWIVLVLTELRGVKTLTCLPGYNVCTDGSGCYKQEERCDGRRVCCNWDDEHGCPCPNGQVFCAFRGCVQRCDITHMTPSILPGPVTFPTTTVWGGIPGACREFRTTLPGPLTTPTRCTEPFITCPNGRCVTHITFCYITSSTTTSALTSPTSKWMTDNCPESHPFTCKDNSNCYSYSQFCDNIDHCIDRSDERNCELKGGTYDPADPDSEGSSTTPKSPLPSLQEMFTDPSNVWFPIVIAACVLVIIVAIILTIVGCFKCGKKKPLPQTNDVKDGAPVTFTVDMENRSTPPNIEPGITQVSDTSLQMTTVPAPEYSGPIS